MVTIGMASGPILMPGLSGRLSGAVGSSECKPCLLTQTQKKEYEPQFFLSIFLT